MNEWRTLGFILLFVTNSVSRFVANLWIGRIKNNLKKKRVFLCDDNFRVGKSTY